MPWIRKGRKEIFVRPPAPDTSLLHAPPGHFARNPSLREEWMRQRQALQRQAYRTIMEWLEYYKYCPRKACRRGGACKSPTAECHEENFALLKEHFYPTFLKALRAHMGKAGPEARYDPKE